MHHVRTMLPLSAILLCACASQLPAPGITMSTTGTTLVRSASVTNVCDDSNSARGMTEVSVRFDNGDERTYRIETGESFRIGDAVTVTTSKGVTRITH